MSAGTSGSPRSTSKPAEFDAFYNGYCNGTLWPLFHYFPDRFIHEQRQYEAYQAVNARFARQLMKVIKPGDAIWVHDYQLIPSGGTCDELGFSGAIGFFLHIPFPHSRSCACCRITGIGARPVSVRPGRISD